MAKSNEPQIEIGEITPDKPFYVRRTERAIRELALAIRAGDIFGSWQIHETDKHLMNSIFMGLMFLDTLYVKMMTDADIVHVYGSVSTDSFPRSINGYPMFHRFNTIDREDFTRLTSTLKKLEEFLGANDEGSEECP